jgi:hypothetical protein
VRFKFHAERNHFISAVFWINHGKETQASA